MPPKLYSLTDVGYVEPQQAALPAEIPPELKRVYITGEKPVEDKGYTEDEYFSKPYKPLPELPSSNIIEKLIKTLGESEFSKGHPLGNQLFGTGGEERYQLWPERMLREGATAAGDIASGKVPQWAIDPKTGDVHTSSQMVEKAQEMSALAGTGGLAGVTDATLGATPFLRPALKYKDKLYKGKEGQQHLDVIPENLYTDFQKKAMSGEDIAEYNFGFINDKGHFLDREKALKYGIDTGIIDPQAGKFGALTSTLMADSSKPGVAIEAAKTAQPFYSALEHNVGKISQSKMTGDQWLGTLSNKPGVKPEEMQWTGLADFLAENKGKPVTKAQIEEHLAANKVELKEVKKGAEKLNAVAKDFDAAVGNGIEWGKGKLYSDEIKRALINEDLTPADLPAHLQGLAKNLIDANKENIPTKYHSYQLPGGENYREMLLTLPEQKLDFINKANDMAKKEGWSSFKDAPEKLRNEIEADIKQFAVPGYRSSHWDEPNILAHVRMNDRTIDGKKSLHLEEIQSDWHQQGRDKGYRPEQEKKLASLVKQRDDMIKNNPEKIDELNSLHDQIRKLGVADVGVPDAPFKKSWHELALKRMLREAAEKGYDRLSWTPGEAQAARYDLSKQVDEVRLVPKNKNTDPNFEYRIDAFKNGERVTTKPANSEKEVADIVGKEVAKKLFEENKEGKGSALKGQQLSIGGEGMKGFYDQIIPKALEKLGKEHGVKVKKGEVVQGEIKQNMNNKWIISNRLGSFNTKAEAEAAAKHPIYYIDIPQSLKDTATQKGFPLFAKGGYMLQPVDFDPFAQEQR